MQSTHTEVQKNSVITPEIAMPVESWHTIKTANGNKHQVFAANKRLAKEMLDIKKLSEKISTLEEFESLKPVQNHLDDNASLDGTMFETYGAELSFVVNMPKENIWTYKEEDGVIFLDSGYWLVNRLGYLVTSLPYLGELSTIVLYEENEDYENDDEDED